MLKKHFAGTLVVLIYCLAANLSILAQSIGGGLGQPISGSLGGLIDKGVFSKIAQPSKKAKSQPAVKPPTRTPTITAGKNAKISSAKTTKTATASAFNPLIFKPIANTGLDWELARTFSQKRNEQEIFVNVFQAVKPAFEAEAAKMGRKNDVAMAVTFFIATSLMVYHNDLEPSEQAIESVYQALANSLIEEGKMAATSNLEKQKLSEKLVYISGFVLAGYMKGKQDNDANTIQVFRSLAGICLQSLMQIDPNSIRFSKTGLQAN